MNQSTAKSHYVGALLLTQDGKIILQHRDNIPHIKWPNTWSVFGGGVERGEEIEEALSRELEEELGLDLSRYRFVFYKTFEQRQVKTPEVSGDIDCHIFIVYDVNLEDIVVHEGQGYVFFHDTDEDVWQKASPTMREIISTYVSEK